jgi:ABC-2 type transport system ATP-binding protein
MTAVIQAQHLGKRHGRTWALQDCSLAIEPGRVTALVGPNGAGKTTLLHLAAGFLRPSSGEITTLGCSPTREASAMLPRLSFVAQDHPLYRSFTVEEMLTMGRRLNPRWDDELPKARLACLRIPLDRRVGKLSGGQRAQVALALALGKRPELLLLDEPLANLDPLARREFLGAVVESVAEDGTSVLLCSHNITDMERVCDHLVILSSSRVQLAGDIADLLRTHKRLVGPRQDPSGIGNLERVVQASHTERQTTMLARVSGPILDPRWQVNDISLEDLVLAYLALSSGPVPAAEIESAAQWMEVLS